MRLKIKKTESKAVLKKLFISLTVLLIGILSCMSVIDGLFQKTFVRELDAAGSHYFNETVNRSIYTFAIVRGINGIISVIQGTTVSVSPAGVGVQLAMGEVLDPVNDLVERFSWVMLVSATSLGIQKVLMEMGAWFGFKVLLSFSMLVILLGIWTSEFLKTDLIALGCKLTLVSVIIRFCIPSVAIISEELYELFLEKKYAESVRSLEKVEDEIKETHLIRNDDRKKQGEPSGYLDTLKQMYENTKDVVAIREKILLLKEKLSDYVRHTTNLIIVFMLQTVIIPIVTLWGMSRLVSYLWGNDIMGFWRKNEVSY